MLDRFLVLLNDGSTCYTTNFNILCEACVIDIIRHERTFDNGITWTELKR